MTTQKNVFHSQNHHAQSLTQHNEVEVAAEGFIRLYNSRASFFTDKFIRRVKEGHRKALAELLKHVMPPTQMDLRQEFLKCLKASTPDDYSFTMEDGKVYTMQELKRLVPQWAAMAEKALMESDPALADKLMSRAQWDARSAFEVTFVTAMNELDDIKKTGLVNRSYDQYKKWTIEPLQKAIESVKAVNPPGNSMIGYVNRIPLSEALEIAEDLPAEFQKTLSAS
jgi:hypothetical protein